MTYTSEDSVLNQVSKIVTGTAYISSTAYNHDKPVSYTIGDWPHVGKITLHKERIYHCYGGMCMIVNTILFA